MLNSLLLVGWATTVSLCLLRNLLYNAFILFVYDRYQAHLNPQIIQSYPNYNNILFIIQDVKTIVIRCLDMTVNKPFKEYTEETYEGKEMKEDVITT